MVIDLAVNSSDRQTKVVACELLHSIVVFMIGSGEFYCICFFVMSGIDRRYLAVYEI